MRVIVGRNSSCCCTLRACNPGPRTSPGPPGPLSLLLGTPRRSLLGSLLSRTARRDGRPTTCQPDRATARTGKRPHTMPPSHCCRGLSIRGRRRPARQPRPPVQGLPLDQFRRARRAGHRAAARVPRLAVLLAARRLPSPAFSPHLVRTPTSQPSACRHRRLLVVSPPPPQAVRRRPPQGRVPVRSLPLRSVVPAGIPVRRRRRPRGGVEGTEPFAVGAPAAITPARGSPVGRLPPPAADPAAAPPVDCCPFAVAEDSLPAGLAVRGRAPLSMSNSAVTARCPPPATAIACSVVADEPPTACGSPSPTRRLLAEASSACCPPPNRPPPSADARALQPGRAHHPLRLAGRPPRTTRRHTRCRAVAEGASPPHRLPPARLRLAPASAAASSPTGAVLLFRCASPLAPPSTVVSGCRFVLALFTVCSGPPGRAHPTHIRQPWLS